MSSTKGILYGPRVGSSGGNTGSGIIDYGCCRSCHLLLRDPFIRCHGCPVAKNADPIYICLSCFSKGREFLGHRNDHSYSVIKTDFSLFDPEWTAEEELQLMNALLTQGHGNWDELAKCVPLKTADQCKLHFDKFYIENSAEVLDNSWKVNTGVSFNRSQPIPHLTNPQKFHDGVPRPVSNNVQVAGYNAARAEFEWEYDNTAEMDICNIDHRHLAEALKERTSQDFEPLEENEVLSSNLSMAALEIYNSRLKSRMKRKRIVREFGLLNRAKAMSLPNRYPLITNGGGKYEDIFRFGRLMCSMDFDYFLEGLSHEMELRQKIVHLQEYRNNGLSRLHSVAFFTKLRVQRERNLHDLSALTETVSDWRSVNPMSVNYICDKKTGQIIPTTVGRRSAAPLDIVGLPGFEKLTSEEKEVCSESRVLPEIYLEIKEVLVAECLKTNGLRLADARPLVKIDVNKTRKLYDFLIKKELIFLPRSTTTSTTSTTTSTTT